MTHEQHSPTEACCQAKHSAEKKPWYRDGLFLILLAAALLIAASYFFKPILPFRRAFFEYLRMIGWAVALGFAFGGVIDYWIPREYISKHLSRPRKRTVLYSVGFGFLMSACSHGILALAVELHKKGASGPAVVSFLLASPWANLPVTFLLIGLFGWKGFVLISAALVVAVTTGLIFQILERKGLIEGNRHVVEVESGFSIRKDLARRFRSYRLSFGQVVKDIQGIAKGSYDLIRMVLFWIVLGVVLASFSAAFIPGEVFHRFFGPTAAGLLATAVLAALLEVCSEGTAPLAFELYRQTGAFGNSFVFLMGGVVTDYTEIGLLWSTVGKRTALWMVLIALPQVILLGALFNLFLK